MNKADLLEMFKATAAEVLKPKAVTVKGWGKVYIRALTVADVEEQNAEGDTKTKSTLARGAARLLCDENGKRLFDPNNQEDVSILSQQPWSKLRQLLQESDDDMKGEATEKK